MELSEIRAEIDRIDEELAELINRRMAFAAKVAKYKQEHNLPVLDLAREEEVLQKAEERCGFYGRELFQQIMDASKEEQTRLL